MSLPQLSQNGHPYHHRASVENSIVHEKYKKERSPNSTPWRKLYSRVMPTDNITCNTNQMNQPAWYGSLPYKHRARIADRQQEPETLLGRPTTKYQHYPLSSDQLNKYSTLPRPPKSKLYMQEGEYKKVSSY